MCTIGERGRLHKDCTNSKRQRGNIKEKSIWMYSVYGHWEFSNSYSTCVPLGFVQSLQKGRDYHGHWLKKAMAKSLVRSCLMALRGVGSNNENGCHQFIGTSMLLASILLRLAMNMVEFPISQHCTCLFPLSFNFTKMRTHKKFLKNQLTVCIQTYLAYIVKIVKQK